MDIIYDISINRPIQDFLYYTSTEEIANGSRVLVELGRKSVSGIVVGRREEKDLGFPLEKIKEIKKVQDTQPLLSADHIEFGKWIAKRYLCSLGEALFTMLPNAKEEREYAALAPEEYDQELSAKILSEEQDAALSRIRQDGPKSYYLNGITGSGKTEVYLTIAEDRIAQGKQVIYLVPEIALSSQLLEEVKHRFKNNIAVLHSRLTNSQKLHQWRKIQSGEVSLVIGARSAIFAPVRDLGLIIIDEEHESSYKAGSTPRYHARVLAQYLAKKNKAFLIMGSATPSLEASYQMKQKLILELKLTKRVSGGKLPEKLIIPLINQTSPLSPRLIEEMNQCLAEKRQTILFLNRRGFTNFLYCKSCGYEHQCPRCSVSMTYHKSKGQMVCHYCGYKEPTRQQCPSCQSMDLAYGGFGTELVEEEVRRQFPQARIARLDTDATRKKGSLEQTLQEFKEGDIDILLGTQMVAKGLNFPKLKLVGIVLADQGLNIPDFRAAERVHALITQVSGRAGRYSEDGKVLIQSLSTGADAIRLAAEGKNQEFYGKELEHRRLLGFPPFSRLIRLVFRAKDGQIVEKSINQVAGIFQSWIKQWILEKQIKENEISILGPAECGIHRLNSNYRMHLLLSSNNFSRIYSLAQALKTDIKVDSKVYIEYDVDPISLM